MLHLFANELFHPCEHEIYTDHATMNRTRCSKLEGAKSRGYGNAGVQADSRLQLMVLAQVDFYYKGYGLYKMV